MYILYVLLLSSFCCLTIADNSCLYEHFIYGTINLTSMGLRNGQARFRDLSTNLTSSFIYSFNPCYPFRERGCQNVALCQMSSDGLYSFTLAKQNLSQWTTGINRTPILTYKYGSKTVSISMICSATNQDELEILGENPRDYYSMNLRSRCACWNGCKIPAPTPFPTTTASTTSSSSSPPTTNVIYYSSCMYHDSRYGTIDLSSIGHMNGTPTFKDVSSIYSTNYLWSYNPCYKFSERTCQNVAGCQIDKTNHNSYTIGLQEHAYWLNMNGTDNPLRSIVYPSPASDRRLTVQLICDQTITSHRLHILGETSVGEYTMQLTSPCACWNGCTQPSPDPQQFNWLFWIIAGSICATMFVLFCMMITCLFCSKPTKRRHTVLIVDEKTPFVSQYK